MIAALRFLLFGAAGKTPIALLCAATFLCGCQKPNIYQEPPPPPVKFSYPELRTVVEALEFTGTTQPYALVDIRARVEGYLLSINFEEGTGVDPNDLLFQIDPKPFEAIVAQAKASKELAEARLASAKADVMRNEAEVKNAKDQLQRVVVADRASPGAVTKEEIEEKRTAVLSAEALLASAQASVNSSKAEIDAAVATITQAELDLSYCRVTSPIAGRVGRRLVDVGNLVGSGESTVLTNIVSYDPIYVYFNVNENDLLKFIQESVDKEGAARDVEQKMSEPIQVGLADGEDYPFSGIATYSDLAVDQSTGTYLIRGELRNEKRMIPPGAFARVRVPRGEKEALLIDPRAVGRDQTGAFLLVANSENVVERRDVRLVGKYEGLQAIEGDIGPEDRVIVKGLQRARPDAKVTPTELLVPEETPVDPAEESTTASDSEE